MARFLPCVAGLLLLSPVARTDVFDRYTNPVLAKVPAAEGVQEVTRLTEDQILEHDRALPGLEGAFLVVRTTEGRYSKLLIQVGRQKIPNAAPVPIVLIERFLTYKEGQERTRQASGQGTYLFDGFRFSLDLGQVVPAALPADLRLLTEGGKARLEPVGKARLYLVTKPLDAAAVPADVKPTFGEPFQPAYFSGTYQLHDDGRRSGELTLRVATDGEVTGSYFSDKDGRKYDVSGKVGTPRHTIDFSVRFPRSEQRYHGWLFTGDGKALVGYSRIQERETGFYALRILPTP